MKAIVVGGTQRGVGKTTIAAALMLAFKRRGMRVKGFKIGSDFIDPLVHEHAIGVASENLDVYLTSERYAAERVASVADACDVCVIDGISGLYDGRDGMSEEGSTAHVAKLINAGVLLVVVQCLSRKIQKQTVHRAIANQSIFSNRFDLNLRSAIELSSFHLLFSLSRLSLLLLLMRSRTSKPRVTPTQPSAQTIPPNSLNILSNSKAIGRFSVNNPIENK